MGNSANLPEVCPGRRIRMRSAGLILLAVLSVHASALRSADGPTPSSAAQTSSTWRIGSMWTVAVVDPDHKSIGSMIILVTDAKANSCRAGDWKRLELLSYQSEDPNFVARRPLSYLLDGNTLSLGANEICDGYISMHGVLTDVGVSGDYGSLGLGSFRRLGFFAARLIK
jgi:hypothetical protein